MQKVTKSLTMHHSFDRIARAARAPSRMILGMMSGTSADGVDLALVRIDGAGRATRLSEIRTVEIPWPGPLREAFFSLAYSPDAPLEPVLELERELDRFFGECALKALRGWSVDPAQVDAIAFSGQTLFHRGRGREAAPGAGAGKVLTLQLGDGDALARSAGVPVVCQFRRTHIAAGFEGAPLVPLAEALLFAGADEDRMLLNLGGIANLTWIPAARRSSEAPNARPQSDAPPAHPAPAHSVQPADIQPAHIPFATDTGPANTLMDRLVREFRDHPPYDRGGELAARGTVDPELLSHLQTHPFFHAPLPASTGPEVFDLAWYRTALRESASAAALPDQLRTLAELTAWSIARAVAPLAAASPPGTPLGVYVSGGGARNPVLMQAITAALAPLRNGVRIGTSDRLGVDPDFKEAVMFAVLANERLAGDGWIANAEALPDSNKSFTLGRICLPA